MELSKSLKKVPNSYIQQFQNKNAITEVLGYIMQVPTALPDHPLDMGDFVEPLHKICVGAIVNLIRKGAEEVTPDDVYEYLNEAWAAKLTIFTANNGMKFLDDCIECCTPKMFEVHYQELKKWSLLRNLLNAGVDVSEFYSPEETDVKQIEQKRELFEKTELNSILAYYETKIIEAGSMFTKNVRDHRKAGDSGAHEQIDRFMKKKGVELSYASQFYTTIAYGYRRGCLTIGSAGTGVGKTRMSIANICYPYAPRFYDKKTDAWIENPHKGATKNSGALYIGTEMLLLEEVEPIIYGYMADVDTDHILQGMYAPGEKERVDKAIDYLNKEGGIYLEYLPGFTVASIEVLIKKYAAPPYNVRTVFFDYMFPSAELCGEYRGVAGAMGEKEYQALNYLSTKLKDLARAYDISIDTWTQVTGNWKDDKIRDQEIVRGSKGVIDKADVAFIASRPTENELNKTAPCRRDGISEYGEPNLCLTVYKNRAGRYNDVKIWLYVDYATMRVHDLYVTDLEYNPLPIQKSIVVASDEGTTRIFTSKEAKEAYEQGEISEQDLLTIKTEEKNNPSYTGKITREDEKNLIEHQNATAGGAMLNKPAAEVDDDYDKEKFDY